MVISESRQRIIDAAQVLFHAWGYAGVGVRDVCRRATVKRGSFYHHFQSKRELLLEVLEAQEGCCRDLLRAAGEADSPADRIREFFALAGEAFQAQQASSGRVLGCPLTVLISGTALKDEGLRRRLARCQDRLTELVQVEILGCDSGPGEAAENERLLARKLLAYYQGVATLARGLDEPGVPAQMAEGAVSLAGVDRKAGGP